MAPLPETNGGVGGGEGETLSDAWDYKGRPAARSRTGGWTCAATILGSVEHLIFQFNTLY